MTENAVPERPSYPEVPEIIRPPRWYNVLALVTAAISSGILHNWLMDQVPPTGVQNAITIGQGLFIIQVTAAVAIYFLMTGAWYLKNRWVFNQHDRDVAQYRKEVTEWENARMAEIDQAFERVMGPVDFHPGGDNANA